MGPDLAPPGRRDRVELAVLNTPLTTTGALRPAPCALRNLEDDRAYVTHFAWQGASEP